MKTTKEQFINYIVDCVGEGEQEAEQMADDYSNNVEDYVRDCGGGDNEVLEVMAFFK